MLKFNDTPETQLEKIESVDMLRLLENGDPVYMVETEEITFSVDTEDDRKRVEEYMQDDALLRTYK